MSKTGWLVAGIGVGVLGALGVGAIRSLGPKYDSTLDLRTQVVRNLRRRRLDLDQDPETKQMFVLVADGMNVFEWAGLLKMSQTVRSTQELRPSLAQILHRQAREVATAPAQASADPPPPPEEALPAPAPTF